MDQLLWLNLGIMVNNRPVHWDTWIRQGIMFVSDLFMEDGLEISWEVFKNNYNVNWLDWLTMLKSIPPVWKSFLKDEVRGD